MGNYRTISLCISLAIIVFIIMGLPMRTVASSSNVSNLSAAQFGLHQYLVYQNKTGGSNIIYFKESSDGGTTFSHPMALSNNVRINSTLTSPDSINPKIGAFGHDVYVIWEGVISGSNHNLFYVNSTNDGKTFGSVVDVSKNRNVDVIQSTLLVDRDTGDVFVAYINNDGSVETCHVHCD